MPSGSLPGGQSAFCNPIASATMERCVFIVARVIHLIVRRFAPKPWTKKEYFRCKKSQPKPKMGESQGPDERKE
jgi:hypothetical protein